LIDNQNIDKNSQSNKSPNICMVFLKIDKATLDCATQLLADALKTPHLDAAADAKILQAQELLLPTLLQ
jgi:hypothetical protein